MFFRIRKNTLDKKIKLIKIKINLKIILKETSIKSVEGVYDIISSAKQLGASPCKALELLPLK